LAEKLNSKGLIRVHEKNSRIHSDKLQNKYTICKGIKKTIFDNLLKYKKKWIQHVNRMPCNRIHRVTKHYSATGKRNHGRPLKKPWIISNLMHKFLICFYVIHLLKSSTCFEHCPAHLQEVYVVIVYMQPLVLSLSAGDCLVTIPEAAYIQLRRRPPEDEQGNARNM
jgi:hypothetical protein